ncbi:Large ribosomal subunit protein eL6-like protein [Drosera capensis]
MAQPSKPRSSRNPDLIRGIGKYSRSVMYHKRGLWAIKTKNGGVFPKHEAKKKVEEVEEKKVKWYLADDVKVPLKNKRKKRPTKLRASITPGTVLIILAGPFAINGVPLRRVNQAYVIATSTKVDISGVNVEKFDDKYFSKKADKKKNIKEEAEFFEAERKARLQFFAFYVSSMAKTKLPDEKKDDQKAVDADLIKTVECVPDLKTYLGARFSLQDGMKPHELLQKQIHRFQISAVQFVGNIECKTILSEHAVGQWWQSLEKIVGNRRQLASEPGVAERVQSADQSNHPERRHIENHGCAKTEQYEQAGCPWIPPAQQRR